MDAVTDKFKFYFLSCLIVQTKAASIRLNRLNMSEDSEQPCLVPNSTGIPLSFSPLNLNLAIGLL